MSKINCSECEDKGCPQRIEGALCSKNPETAQLIKIYSTRDPILIAKNLVEILGTEKDRYDKAVRAEGIGEITTKKIITKKGEVVEIEEEGLPNPVITDMAKSLLKGGKIIHDIVNPPKVAPLFQQNIQNNFAAGVANEILNLPENERAQRIKFIDEKLNA